MAATLFGGLRNGLRAACKSINVTYTEMVKALLLRADGTYKQVTLRYPCDYRKALGGKPEMLATRSRALCYVRMDPQKHRLPVSDFSELLDLLGFEPDSIRGAEHYVMGDALLCGSAGDMDADLPQSVCDLVRAYTQSDDRGLFLLEMQNRVQHSDVSEEDDDTSEIDALS